MLDKGKTNQPRNRRQKPATRRKLRANLLFVVCLILFLIWDRAATSTFFLLVLMATIDVIAGFSVTINAARRDRSVGGPA